MPSEIDSLPVENWDIDTLIIFLRGQDLKFDDDDFEILRREKITGFDFTNMTKEEFERCGLKIGPSKRLVKVAETLKDPSKCSFSYRSLKQVLKEYNSSKILPGTYPLTDEDEEEYTNNKSLPGTYPLKDDDEKLPQSVGKIKLLKSEQESTNDKISILPPLSKKSIGTQTTNFSADQKSLTYLIQGLISRSLSHFPLNEWVFINNTTKGVCRISSVEPRLSSVSLYCEYELGKVYTHHYSPAFSGYPIALKSPFSPSERIITGLDESKTKFIDNINYVIEFTEMLDFVEPVKSSSNISSSSTAVSSTKTIATQTRPYVEDTKELTYIAKGIMFKSICWFTWDEQEAFRLGKKKGVLRLVSSDPKLAGVTLTCNYQLSKFLCSFQGDIGYPMIVSCSYGSVKTLLTEDKKKIMDNHNYNLTFIS
ncbi:unnamed protein product [Rhizophagus irregularis]|nr:unnamed protein product [Rhizophagus irregularis]